MPDQISGRRPGFVSRVGVWAPDAGVLFSGLAVVGFANGISHRVIAALSEDAARALLQTFDVGAVAWIALFMCVHLLARPGWRTASGPDLAVAGAAIIAFLIPAAPLSWLALTGIGAYVVKTSPAGSPQRRGAWILLALTVPLFWSRIAFSLLSDGILRFDAVLVGWILGMPRVGNSIAFADGWGYFWIAPACSSLANVSLALLCWVLVTQTLDKGHSNGFRYCVAACLAVVAINVARLVLTGISYRNYELLHGGVGNLVTGWLIFAVTLAICLYGATREPRHAVAASG